MSQKAISLEGAKLSAPLSRPWHRASLKWKIGTAFSVVILILGLFVIGIVYYVTGSALRAQVELRASAIAANLSDAAAPYVSRRNPLELDALIAKYGRLEGVAYAYIEDTKGEINASSLQPFPAELKDTAAIERRTASSRVTRIRGKSVYETRAPMLDGQLGTVRVGLWAEAVQAEVRGTLLSIIGLIGLCVLAGIALSLVLVNRAIRPILDLKASADEISRGHLDTPVSVHSEDEVGELARSLERMRASLKAAMSRLSRN
jgi:HAMP domain-containing protein/cbb3-type cytochrome oxidase subunit 3